MKKTTIGFLSVLTLLTFFGMQARAQFAVKANPVAILGGYDLLSFELGVPSIQSSFQISGNYGNFKKNDYQYKGKGGGVQYRYYFKETLVGRYAGAFGFWTNGDVDLPGNLLVDPDDAGFTNSGFGVLLGTQKLIGKGFVFDANASIGYQKFSYNFPATQYQFLYEDLLQSEGLYFGGSLGFGYLFGRNRTSE